MADSVEGKSGMTWGSEEELVSLDVHKDGGTWAQTVRTALTAWMEGSGWGKGKAPAVTVRCWHTDPLTAWEVVRQSPRRAR